VIRCVQGEESFWKGSRDVVAKRGKKGRARAYCTARDQHQREYTAKKASDMNGGGSRALLGQSKKKKPKSKLAAEASARKRKEQKERRLAVQQQESTGDCGGFRDTEDVTCAHGMHLM
jgi:magnesium-transporting ATPase (P-type)